MEVLQCFDEQLHIIVLASHQVSTPKVNPLQLRKPPRELLFNMHQCPCKNIATRLTMAMNMEPLHILRQSVGQIPCQHSKPRPRRTRIVQLRLYLAIFRINTQPHRSHPLHLRCKPLILAQRIEGDMARTCQNLLKLFLRISWRIRVCLAAKLLLRQPRLTQRRCRRVPNILPKNRKTLPQGKCLKRQDDFHLSPLRHTANQLQVPPQQRFLHHITWRWNLFDILF